MYLRKFIVDPKIDLRDVRLLLLSCFIVYQVESEGFVIIYYD